MTPNKTLRLLLGALLILPLAAPVFGDSTPEARKWLEKLISIYDRGPFKVEYTATLDMSQLGQPVVGTLKGSVAQADRTHNRVQLSVELDGMPGATGPTRIRMLNVSDGTTLWTEMENPALGGTQITRIAIADAAKLSQATGGLSPTSMDPVAQLEDLTRTMDFEVLEKSGGRVTLRGRITDATRAELSALVGPGVDAFIFVLDERTGFPVEVRADGEKPFVTMSFENLELLKAGAFDAGLFEYSPPEGAPVMDLGAMIPQVQGQEPQSQ